MVKEDAQGYVYILTNPSFKEDWVKIGKSSRPVDVRSKELDNTAVPLPFEIFATLKTVKYNITTIINTHDMNSVIKIGQRINFLYHGQLWWKGDKNSILTTENKELQEFVFATELTRRLR